MNRQAVYFYYTLSLAKAFHLLGVNEVEPEARGGQFTWGEKLAEELLRRQEPDGSWINSAVAVREDDSIVATCMAAEALAACR